MIDPDLITARLTALSEQVARLRSLCPKDPALLTDRGDALDLVSYNLLRTLEMSGGIAVYILAEEGWDPTGSFDETFRCLQERGVITPASSEALQDIAGIWHSIMHHYTDTGVEGIHATAVRSLPVMEKFREEVSGWMLAQVGHRIGE